ncbi:hypothetical protein CERSUDRAFT_99035 [Gelatoporia subvermispora B]|uniref:Cleavage/polyadenylation specificity factor A subunit C-terminal domain-containing protein n=1 Tax=Ceriporiopsis subvermispora (strain B) TaxID=914234 RepID=M2R498_CERS8|nr:hypothetical protein CERSUDRAFT_99035 [Gelatoporia subvermispora B]
MIDTRAVVAVLEVQCGKLCSSLHNAQTAKVTHLDNNEMAFSLVVAPFAARGGELHLAVDTLRTSSSHHRHALAAETNDGSLAVMALQGKLVVGVGQPLYIYDMGKKLLRKVENKTFPAALYALYADYKAPENHLLVFVEGTQPREIAAMTMISHNPGAAAGHFGNAFASPLYPKVPEQVAAGEQAKCRAGELDRAAGELLKKLRAPASGFQNALFLLRLPKSGAQAGQGRGGWRRRGHQRAALPRAGEQSSPEPRRSTAAAPPVNTIRRTTNVVVEEAGAREDRTVHERLDGRALRVASGAR